MKVKVGAYLLMAVMVFSGLAIGVSGSQKVDNKENAADNNVVNAGYLFLTRNNGEWCTVSTDGGNLNVRNSRGVVVSKLANGTDVYVDAYEVGNNDSSIARVSVERRGKLVVLGWVAAEYLSC